MRPELAALGGWPAILGRLLAREDLHAHEAGAAMASVLAGDSTPAQLAAFLVALRMKGEAIEEMTGMVEAMLAAAERVELAPGTAAVDTCGTGGSSIRRRGAYNVSTIASFVIAGAGVAVCKHGNRAASSTCGSADLLEALGMVIDLGPPGVARCVAEAGMGFCFAPRFHPAMRHAGPTRREIGVATVFNFLGPLANPAGVRRQVVGVSDAAMAEKVVGVLQAKGAERALVVYGHDGLDELTTTTTSTVLELRDGAVEAGIVDPTEWGMARAEPSSILGGDVDTNRALAQRVLGGEPGAHRDLVVLNAAAGLVVAGVAEGLAEGCEAAAAAIDGGAAARAVDRVVMVSREAAGVPAIPDAPLAKP
ncbi:MAG TPA: anthranilate phosphoribosyltransferase [Acidimicrobiales bacterium]|nr:anthranilate phosphoribosyltransferase [Acidimicrobiales bacterium]